MKNAHKNVGQQPKSWVQNYSAQINLPVKRVPSQLSYHSEWYVIAFVMYMRG